MVHSPKHLLSRGLRALRLSFCRHLFLSLNSTAFAHAEKRTDGLRTARTGVDAATVILESCTASVSGSADLCALLAALESAGSPRSSDLPLPAPCRVRLAPRYVCFPSTSSAFPFAPALRLTAAPGVCRYPGRVLGRNLPATAPADEDAAAEAEEEREVRLDVEGMSRTKCIARV